MSTRKKVFLTLGALVLIVVGYVVYIMLTTRSHSPAAVAEYQQNALDLSIEYCQPYKKERLIFGTAEEGALLPHGKYWRLGANEATKLTTGSAVNFGGQLLEAGSYSLYAFPDADHWVIGINSVSDRWGATAPDFSKDLGRVKIPVITTDEPLEQFTINITSQGSDDAVVIMQWDRTKVEIPVSSR